MNNRIVNAKIKNVSITKTDRDCLVFQVLLKGDGWECAYGGGYPIVYYNPETEGYTVRSGGIGVLAMMKIMDVVGVQRWEDLVGKYVRVVDTVGSVPIKKIGNIVEDKWFDIGEFFYYGEG